MKNKRPLTIQQHARLGEACQDLLATLDLVHMSQGTNSASGRLAKKISKDIDSLRSSMEDAAYRDGFSHVATDFYYHLSPHHGVDSIEELVEQQNTK